MSSPAVALRRLQPMPLARLHAPFDHPDWTFELKYDGWRALAYVDCGCSRLVSRNGNEFKRFGELCAAIGAAVPGAAALDCEIACLDGDGKPQFYELFRQRVQPTYCGFGVLWLSGRMARS